VGFWVLGGEVGGWWVGVDGGGGVGRHGWRVVEGLMVKVVGGV